MNNKEAASARKVKIRQLLLSLFLGLLLALVVGYAWTMHYDEVKQANRDQIDTDAQIIGEVISDNINAQIRAFENLKGRIENTDGEHLNNLEYEAELILEQHSSVRFIQHVSAEMIAEDLFAATEIADEAGISGNMMDHDQVRAEWLRARVDSSTTITVWTEMAAGDELFILHTPLFYSGNFRGTLSYGLDFTDLFDDRLRDRVQYQISLMDESGSEFYQHGDSERLLGNRQSARAIQIQVIQGGGKYWYLNVTPNTQFSEGQLQESLLMILILGIALTLLFTIFIYLIMRYFSVRKSKRVSDRKLNAVIDSSPYAIYVVNNKGVVTDFWNNAAEQMLGWTSKEVYNQYLPHVTKEPPTEFQEMIETVIKGEVYRNKESKRVAKDGTKLMVQLYAKLLEKGKNGNGEVIVKLEDITRQKRTELELNNEKQFGDTILKGLPGQFYLIDKKRRLTRWNRNVNHFFGMTDDELKKITFLDLFVEDERLKVLEALQNASITGKLEVETVVRSKGELHDFFINGTQMKIGREHYIVVNGINITERNKIRNELIKSVDEKDVLLSEIHHRVKNNLAIIANLIDIQLFDMEDEAVADVLRETQNRIYSIAGVHEMLYDVKNFSKIEFKKYLQNLFERIFRLYNEKHKMTGFDMKVEVEYLNINQAIPLGLMLAELITNTFKHAFELGKVGTISIEITGGPEQITIIYRDNGNGMAPELFNEATTMGLTLIRSLLNQLNATYSINGKEGFELEFTFSEQLRGSHSNL